MNGPVLFRNDFGGDMLGFYYILLCFVCGYIIYKTVIGNLQDGEENGVFIKLPAYYLFGTLFVTWSTYLVAYLLRNTSNPLFNADKIVMPGLTVLCSAYFINRILKENREYSWKEQLGRIVAKFKDDKLTMWSYVAFLFCVLILSSFLMYYTFNANNESINVGFSVFSDFAPHLAVIRSFSKSNNFPTQYPHFAGEDVKYHFMYQFMVGNLELLGMRIDHAFNIPSIISMVSTYMLLFAFAYRITGKRAVAYLSTFLFTFRSSFSVFKYMASLPKAHFWKRFFSNDSFIGYTEHEEWGLWNLNVYVNQRHFLFSVAMLLFVLLLFYPYMEKMAVKLEKALMNEEKETKLYVFLKTCFFSKSSFGFKNLKMAIGMGVILGSLAFWNGSVLVAMMCILFFMAAFSDDRLDYLITAIIALLLGMLQSKLFISGSAVSPEFFFGFIAENKTIWGVLDYFFRLTGILIPIAFVALFKKNGMKKYLFGVFFVPIILAFNVMLIKTSNTPYYVAVNHKWVMISLMLISIYAAEVVVTLARSGRFIKILSGAVLVFTLTFTGIFDLLTLVNIDKNAVSFKENDPVTLWVEENATADDIFLTSSYSLNNVVLGGAMLFYGWPYYAASAGYDTDERDLAVRQMYMADSPGELMELTAQYNIRYIIIDREVKDNLGYSVREDIIEDTFDCVFACYEGTDLGYLRIFDTKSIRIKG